MTESSESYLRQGLILLGTVHTDRLGFARTAAFLVDYQPDLIFLELSPFALQYRHANTRALRKSLFTNLREAARERNTDFQTALRNPHVKAIMAQIGLPFEYRASAAYAKRTGARVVLVDDSEFSREWIRTWPELVSLENLESLLLQGGHVPASILYRRADAAISGDSTVNDIWAGGDLALWQKRENRIASRILSALSTGVPRKPVYIGGWRHLLSGGPLKTVRDILGLDRSSCFLLNRISCAIS